MTFPPRPKNEYRTFTLTTQEIDLLRFATKHYAVAYVLQTTPEVIVDKDVDSTSVLPACIEAGQLLKLAWACIAQRHHFRTGTATLHPEGLPHFFAVPTERMR